MKLRGNTVLIKLDTPEEKTTNSGIVIPVTQKDPPVMGTLIAVGDGYLAERQYIVWTDENNKYDAIKTDFVRVPVTDVKVGDRVVFPSWAGETVTVDGEDYLFMTVDMLLAVVEE